MPWYQPQRAAVASLACDVPCGIRNFAEGTTEGARRDELRIHRPDASACVTKVGDEVDVEVEVVVVAELDVLL